MGDRRRVADVGERDQQDPPRAVALDAVVPDGVETAARDRDSVKAAKAANLRVAVLTAG